MEVAGDAGRRKLEPDRMQCRAGPSWGFIEEMACNCFAYTVFHFNRIMQPILSIYYFRDGLIQKEI